MGSYARGWLARIEETVVDSVVASCLSVVFYGGRSLYTLIV